MGLTAEAANLLGELRRVLSNFLNRPQGLQLAQERPMRALGASNASDAGV